jgi:hypothetical protein
MLATIDGRPVQEVEPKTIFASLILVEQPLTQVDPHGFRYLALENRVLDSLAEVSARARYAP